MPAQHRRVGDGHVVLEVLLSELDRTEQPPAAPLKEAAGLLDVPRLIQEPTEFDQAHLDPGMSADRFATTVPELADDVVGDRARDRHERVIGAGDSAAGDGRLEQVPVVVELVAPLEVAVARCLAFAAEVGVEVAIGFLRGCDDRGQGRMRSSSAASPVRPCSQLIASSTL